MIRSLTRRFSQRVFQDTTYSPASIPKKLTRADYAPLKVVEIRSTLSPTYFTGRPLLHDTFYQLDSILKQHGCEQSEETLSNLPKRQDAHSEQWISRELLEQSWKFKISPQEYAELTSKLDLLQTIPELSTNERVLGLLKKFSVAHTSKYAQKRSTELDEWGRSYAMGYRRKLRAHVWLTEAKEPGEGRVFVDGVDFVDFFPRFLHRNKVVIPFEVTDTMGKYNVWCEMENAVLDGELGKGSVCDAMANGIANALLVLDKDYQEVLDGCTCSEADEW